MKDSDYSVGSCEVGDETSSTVEVVESFDRSFAAPEVLCCNELEAINKSIFISES